MNLAASRKKCFLVICVAVISASGCSFFSGGEGRYGHTISSLNTKRAAPIPDEVDPVPLVSLDDVEDSYRSALDVARDPDIRHKILIRLADLEMAKSEERQLSSVEQGEFFTDAISLYQELLVLNKAYQHEDATPTNERILYQLSKAYALDGRLEESNEMLGALVKGHPDSIYAAESEFRRAELAFSQKNYALAETLYGEVMAKGKNSPFYRNAVYMHGWSQFKRNRYRASIKSFTEVLDSVLIESKSEAQLSNSERNISQDTMRILAIVFSYLDGADTITDVYANIGERHYQHRLYQQLGDLFLEKKRYRDSADTFRHYVQKFPATDYAPLFSVRAIDVYDQGNFPSEILPAKEEYVTNYGVNSEFWAKRSVDQRTPLLSYLKLYIEELSSYYHSRAQSLVSAQGEYARIRQTGTRKEKSKLLKPDDAIPVFIRAAGFYNQFIRTFAEDQSTPRITYLMGEAYFEANYFSEAVDAYETVAYEYLDKQYGADAGFSAIVGLNKLVEQAKTVIPISMSTAVSVDPTLADAPQASPDIKEDNADSPIVAVVTELDKWRKRRIASAINFSDYYPQHPEAVAVLTQTAQDVFESNDLAKAIEIATRIVAWQPTPNSENLKTAQLVIAHSQFELGKYDIAEAAYRDVLTLLPSESLEREGVIERIAASIFKSSELLIVAGDKQQAVDRLLSIQDVAPNSDIAINAQYDASVYLIELKNWTLAEQVLLQFSSRYPANPLSKDIPQKLAFVYQEAKEWAKAASVLKGMAANESDPELRRQSRYLSAELFEKSGRVNDAIAQYRDYATAYPQPFGLATEARFKLTELYGQIKQEDKRRIWLKELIRANTKAGNNKTARSNYLAAMGESVFAEDTFVAFNRVKLTQPIKKSLKKKKAALKKSIEAYKKLSAYGVAQFATLSNYKIAEIYVNLSTDLLDSERPKGLDDLALEQYEILMEEQAFPFEDKAIDIHTKNSQRAWDGIYDDWVKQSFDRLAKLLPARYGKKEEKREASDALF